MRRRLCVWLAACALAFAGEPTWATEGSLGRLFHTPEERAALDAARRQPPIAVPAEMAVQKNAPSAQPAPRREGLIERGGKPVAEWVDGALRTAPVAPARIPVP